MLSDRIKLLRKKKGLSQEELAVHLNVVRQTVSKWETGNGMPEANKALAARTVKKEERIKLRIIAGSSR